MHVKLKPKIIGSSVSEILNSVDSKRAINSPKISLTRFKAIIWVMLVYKMSGFLTKTTYFTLEVYNENVVAQVQLNPLVCIWLRIWSYMYMTQSGLYLRINIMYFVHIYYHIAFINFWELDNLMSITPCIKKLDCFNSLLTQLTCQPIPHLQIRKWNMFHCSLVG